MTDGILGAMAKQASHHAAVDDMLFRSKPMAVAAE
jgi:hypothetical protein